VLNELDLFKQVFNQPRVCRQHVDSFSKDYTVCRLEAARNELLRTFWYVDGYLKNLHNKDTKEKRLDHITEIAATMVERYAGRIAAS
jgi:hypothetical protein